MRRVILSFIAAAFALGIMGVSTAWAQENAPANQDAQPPRFNKQWRQNCPCLPPQGQNQAPLREQGAMREQALEKRAQILGMNVDELKAQLEQGKKLYEIAQEKGITPEQMREQVMTQRREQTQERLNQMVEQGKITREQANKRLEQLDKEIQQQPPDSKPKFQWLKNTLGKLGWKWGRG